MATFFIPPLKTQLSHVKLSFPQNMMYEFPTTKLVELGNIKFVQIVIKFGQL